MNIWKEDSRNWLFLSVDRSTSYSTTQYKSSELEEGPKFLEKTAFKPKLLNEFIHDPETFKSSTISTSKPDAKTVSTGSNMLPSNMALSQQSDSSASSSHGKILPVNEGTTVEHTLCIKTAHK